MIIFLARRLFASPKAADESGGTTIDSKPLEKSSAEINAEVAEKEQAIAESAETAAEKVVEKAEKASAAASEKAAEKVAEVQAASSEASKETVKKAKKAGSEAAKAVAKEAKQAATHAAPLAVEVPDELQAPVAELEETKDALTRHRLFQHITENSYKNRTDAASREVSKEFSKRHIAEFADIVKPLKKANGGKLPHVATFQNYATLLAEDGDFAAAIAVCEQAQGFGLDDKTKTGFPGRIERIKKQQTKA